MKLQDQGIYDCFMLGHLNFFSIVL